MRELTLKEWLEQNGCREVEPVTARIGNSTYEGCRYKQARQGHTQEGLYLLGKLPASYQRSRRSVYLVDGDSRAWFVASWADAETAEGEEFGAFHYAEHFQLFPWTAPEPIDADGGAPYRRFRVASV